MSVSNKIYAHLLRPRGHKQDEVERAWSPINFSIYDNLFIVLINEAIDEWLSNNVLVYDVCYEVIFKHVVERDGAGAVHSEYFEPIHAESGYL